MPSAMGSPALVPDRKHVPSTCNVLKCNKSSHIDALQQYELSVAHLEARCSMTVTAAYAYVLLVGLVLLNGTHLMTAWLLYL